MNLKHLFAGGAIILSSVLAFSHSTSTDFYTGDFWSGEYPSPVIKVTKNTKVTGTVTLPKATLPSTHKVTCTLKKGVYHPWATKTNATYHSITGVRDYSANHATSLELDLPSGTKNLAIEQGEVVKFLAYYGEGYCLLQAKGIKGASTCLDETTFTITKNSDYYQQYIHVSCLEGYKAYVDGSNEILKIKGIESGNISDYGKVEE